MTVPVILVLLFVALPGTFHPSFPLSLPLPPFFFTCDPLALSLTKEQKLKMLGRNTHQVRTLAFVIFTQHPSYYPPPESERCFMLFLAMLLFLDYSFFFLSFRSPAVVLICLLLLRPTHFPVAGNPDSPTPDTSTYPHHNIHTHTRCSLSLSLASFFLSRYSHN